MARLFNQELAQLPNSRPFFSVQYGPASLIKIPGKGDLSVFMSEPRIDCGPFKKYNSNHGFVDTAGNDEVVQTLSHWSYERSGKSMMLVYLQGSRDVKKRQYALTDPAIHCVDVLRFESTNLGTKGFKRFFTTHQCNQFCIALGLPDYATPRTAAA
jgi:Alpha-kinase family